MFVFIYLFFFLIISFPNQKIVHIDRCKPIIKMRLEKLSKNDVFTFSSLKYYCTLTTEPIATYKAVHLIENNWTNIYLFLIAIRQ